MPAVRRRSRTFSAAGATENSAMTVNLFSVLHLLAFAGVDRSGRGCNPRPARSGASRDAFPSGAWERHGFGGAWGAGLRWGVMPAVRRRSRTFSAAGATENSAMTVNLFSVLHLPAFAGVDRSGRGCNPRPARICQAALGGTHSQAALGNDRGAALGNDKGGEVWGWGGGGV